MGHGVHTIDPVLLHDLACVVHLHSTHSDGTGTVRDILAAARRNSVDVVLLTDHDTLAALPDEGWHDSVLLLVGEEVSPRDHDHTLAFGIRSVVDHRGMTAEEIAAAAPLTFAAHPFSMGSPRFRRFRGMPHSAPAATTGIELWSFLSDTAERAESVRDVLRFIAAPERALDRAPARNVEEWDRLCARRRVVAIGGIDAHQVGVRVLGHVPLRLMGYGRSFRYLRTHVLCAELPVGELEHDRALVYDALGSGRCYIARDSLAPARGFAFWGAESGKRRAESYLPMGGEAGAGDWVLSVRLPRPAELRLIRDGQVVTSAVDAYSLDQPISGAGVFRVEARLHAFGRDRTWILSNPVYLR
jgi:hypothetical protein